MSRTQIALLIDWPFLSAFSRSKTFVYLHLKGDRRLYGWAEEWPDSPTTGHFVIMKAEWILGDNSRVPLSATERILIRADEVEMVEFEKSDDEVFLAAPDLIEASNKTIEFNERRDDCDE